MPTYGGDEVSAVVLDIGTSTTRAGYAGEETPKVVIPTWYGYIPASASSKDQQQQREESYFFGDHGPNFWRPNMQVKNPLKDSMVDDWNAVQKLIKVVFDREMRLGLPGADLEPEERRGILTEHPLLVTEPSWNSKENRERMIEFAFEELDTPAYYSVDRSVMAAFAAGKGTAIVVDIGDDLTTITPICDGFVMRKGIQKSLIAGNVLSSLMLSATEARLPSGAYPHYLVGTKHTNSVGHEGDHPRGPSADQLPPGVLLREDRLPGLQNSKTTESFAHYHKLKLVHDLKESVCEVFPRAWEEEVVATLPPRTFEFPTGQVVQYGRERFGIPEVLFNPAVAPVGWTKLVRSRHGSSTIASPETHLPLSHLLMQSIVTCDIDMQPTLNSNIIITGGSSLIPGLIDRLEFDLKSIAPAMKFKISAPGNLVERKFSSWLGGSILASLGSFHQLWIGKDEYKEQGRSIVHRRCK